MSLRMPQTLAGVRAGEAAFNLLSGELFAEQATNLGRLGRAVEAALSQLAATAPDRREELLQSASASVWRYFVQREMCGMFDHGDAIALYAIPPEVLNRMGSAR